MNKIQTPKMPSRDGLEKAAECLRTLGHPIRLKILFILKHGQYSVGQLAEMCGISSSLASEHLRLMQRCDILECVRDGKQAFYRISEPHLGDVLGYVQRRHGPTAIRRQKK